MTLKQEKYYRYLFELRESGVTNMFGAAPYLEKEFLIPKKEARNILTNWMTNFTEIAKELDIEI